MGKIKYITMKKYINSVLERVSMKERDEILHLHKAVFEISRGICCWRGFGGFYSSIFLVLYTTTAILV